jgi:AcrR family transcriptional regulator
MTTDVGRRERNPRGQGQRLRTALIDAAIDLLAEIHDVDGLSVRAVTARAGVSPTALYLHFADRDELVAAVKDRCFEELRSYARAAEEVAGPDPAAQLRAMCLNYLAFARERPGHYHVLFETRRVDAPAGAGMPAAGLEAFGDLVRAVERCLDGTRDPFETATMLWAGLHGFNALRTMPHFPFPSDEDYVMLLLTAHIRD